MCYYKLLTKVSKQVIKSKHFIYRIAKTISNTLNVKLTDIIKIYLPLSIILSNNIKKKLCYQNNNQLPYIIGITGSVAVGKSTIANILKILLYSWLCYSVELITTDSFLYSNKILVKKKLIQRKGFPESYDNNNLLTFIKYLISGAKNNVFSIPVYSHLLYDIVPNVKQVILPKPQVILLEGLNILQDNNIANIIDFSIYLDAPESLIKKWYCGRLINLYRHKHYYNMSNHKICCISNYKWQNINKYNLIYNILPSKNKANIILIKKEHHKIDRIIFK
ncbi:MAG: type I pantothenate kinase [Candidatus Lightella neohaematopini]|nr:type I pantothenate kinase [Candidatus Lightella neohaematopini]